MNKAAGPLAVYDVREPNWNRLTLDQQQAIRAWAPRQGIDLADVVRIEIHLIDCPLARLTHHARDADGRFVVEQREPYNVVRGTPVDVPIRDMPPVKPARDV